MEADQTQSFNQKLSQWIASQGFWFQLRHSMSGGGGWAMTLSHLTRLGFKVLIALLVAAAVFGIYLIKRVDSGSFIQSLDGGLATGLSASEAKILELRRVQGDAQIRRVGVEGGEKSFFRSLDAGNIRFKMPLMAGLSGTWKAGTLQAKWLEMEVKAGTDSTEQAKLLGDALFRDWAGFDFSSVEVDEASLRWGFSQRAAGRIEKSRMIATRSPEGWRLVLTGGRFSQNWLRDLAIESMIVEIGRGGLNVKEGKFKCGKGTVVFNNVAVTGGDKPQVSGKVEFTNVELSSLLPEAATSLVEGVISGELAISGSTNTVEGIQFEGDVKLAEGSVISLRERIELLKSLALADRFNSYRKVDFTRGSFHLKTGGGSLKLTRVDLVAGDLMTMQGLLEVRYPTDQELSGPEGTNSPGRFAPVFDAKAATESTKGDEMSLSKAGKANSSDSKDMQIFDRRAQERIDEQLEQEQLIRRAQSLRCSGGVRITIPGEAFDRNQPLREAFPVDPGTGRIAMDVPLDGTLFELTRRQAEEISQLTEKR
ncbi:hypothetical protein OKA05_02265 [Luteolibacter arcticus]|uniref:AsmA-like C-terminal domain-containing protein n=1 Tax=Luteolibacter arcticus TaxID=1581411 RepID=A0ABT3GD66_9BACT|nr:hypothetical protein [Luteolibacter arcticus]MCW1921358.1 hypothetical protein [Luteolibacter arcticus]